MPRAVPTNSCLTCRQRKVKCDGNRPVCQKCAKRGVRCERPDPERKFVVYRATYALTEPEREPAMIQTQAQSVLPAQIQSNSTMIRSDENPRLKVPDPTSPTEDLGNETIAGLYHHYIEHLAPWYDLCEHDRYFESLVPSKALEAPVLFCAVIAFSAQHRALTDSRYDDYSTFYHDACIKGLLSGLNDFDSTLQEDYLIAACLLRSYEILRADSRQEQRHLLGAYRFSSTEEIDMTTTGLLQAGAWNYLREEITVALECRRPVRLNVHLDIRSAVFQLESMHANTITYILARIINLCFGRDEKGESLGFKQDDWTELNADLELWRNNLPTSYAAYSRAPISGSPFPSEWYLRPWHVAAEQYCLTATTLMLLYNPDTELDTEIVERLCGIAYTNENKAARVNAFGPIAFCGRFLTCPLQRQGLKRLLLTSSLEIGWPVHRIIEDLETFWNC